MPEGVTTCRQPRCSATIRWALTPNGRRMPVDWPLPSTAQPIPKEANLAVHGDHLGGFYARVVSAEDPVRGEERPAVAHWTTCEDPPPRARAKARPARATRKGPPADQPALLSDAGLRRRPRA